jgi:hypothetical protein
MFGDETRGGSTSGEPVDELAEIEAHLDVLAGEDLEAVTPGLLGSQVRRLGSLLARVEAEAVRRAGEWERRGVWMADGSRAARARHTRERGTGVAAAGDRLQVAARLRSTPVVAAAFATGELSYAKARLLASGVDERLPETARVAFGESEATLVEAAKSLSVGQVRQVMDFWRAHADPNGTLDEANHRYDRRGLSASTTFEGMVAIDGLLDPEAGQIFLRELRAISARMWRADHHSQTDDDACEADPAPRSDRQRNADALLQLVIQGGTNDRHDHTPDRARIAAVIDADTINGRPGRAHWADTHTPIPPQTAQRLACDASIAGIVLDHRLVPLAVTHAKGQVSPGLRAAIVVRDGSCVAPGCSIPARYCDVHHLRAREDGGHHALDNCALLCRHHHRQNHEHRWQTRIDPTTGRAQTRTPDTDWTPADPAPLQHATLARAAAASAGRPPP